MFLEQAQLLPGRAAETGSDAVTASWTSVLRRAGISEAVEEELACRARHNGTSFHVELLSADGIDHTRYFRSIAEQLGLPFCDRLDPARLVMRNRDLLAALKAPHGPRVLHFAS